jgi:predicted DNA-binding protein (MmcQ/YjbR family)
VAVSAPDSSRAADGLRRLTEICRTLPEVEVVAAHGSQHTQCKVRGKTFAYHLVDHHGDGRVALECKAPPGDNEALVASDGERFFLPKYMAHHGWVGLYLAVGEIDWAEVRELVTEAYRLVAPKRLVAQLEAGT